MPRATCEGATLVFRRRRSKPSFPFIRIRDELQRQLARLQSVLRAQRPARRAFTTAVRTETPHARSAIPGLPRIERLALKHWPTLRHMLFDFHGRPLSEVARRTRTTCPMIRPAAAKRAAAGRAARTKPLRWQLVLRRRDGRNGRRDHCDGPVSRRMRSAAGRRIPPRPDRRSP